VWPGAANRAVTGVVKETAVEAMRSWAPRMAGLRNSEPDFWSGVVTLGVEERSRGASKRQQEVALKEGPDAGEVSAVQELHTRAGEDMTMPQTLGAPWPPAAPISMRIVSAEAPILVAAFRRRRFITRRYPTTGRLLPPSPERNRRDRRRHLTQSSANPSCDLTSLVRTALCSAEARFQSPTPS